ncbi:MAG: YggT family protein [Alkaliphilus sp.]|nr:YggT family protein [Alkaliphilus sp.]
MWLIKESINKFFAVIDFLILARIILSWINPNPNSTVTKILYQLTEPILSPFRNLLHRFGLVGAIDFSPFIAVIALNIIRSLILGLL